VTPTELPTDWTLTEVKEEERPLLDRLLQLYLYDFSEIDPDDVGEDGRFTYDVLDRYGREPGHDALLLRVRGKPAGFALVDEQSTLPDSADRHYVHEFHVLRAYRRAGYGLAMAWEVFDRYPGAWQIEVIGPNLAAQAFWRRAVDLYTGGRYRKRTLPAKRFHLVIQEFETSDRAIP
jgi:predicted acetyltransferase